MAIARDTHVSPGTRVQLISVLIQLASALLQLVHLSLSYPDRLFLEDVCNLELSAQIGVDNTNVHTSMPCL